jgi:5-methylcytosine-specific restriction protein B
MNTADRSITQLDTALRRRFEFIEIMPDPQVLANVSVEGVSVCDMLSVMNRRIELLYDRDHTLGHSYLMRPVEEPTLEVLAHIFDASLIPLLQEYFFDDYKKIRAVLGCAADRFIEVRDSGDVFFDDDSYDFSRLKSYRVLKAPIDADAYRAIYTFGRQA